MGVLEEVQDAVLSVVSSAESDLTAEQVCERVLGSSLKDVRVALRNLAQSGDVARTGDKWHSVGAMPLGDPSAHSDYSHEELQQARAAHPGPKSCPSCNKVGGVDAMFGWRRMHPTDKHLVPQSWCIDCRHTSAT